jgi:hypothetical protein
MTARAPFATGYKTREAAEDAIWHAYGEGAVSEYEDPDTESYKTRDGRTRYRITVRED